MEKERINKTINTTNYFFTLSEDCQFHMTESLLEHPETHKAVQMNKSPHHSFVQWDFMRTIANWFRTGWNHYGNLLSVPQSYRDLKLFRVWIKGEEI